MQALLVVSLSLIGVLSFAASPRVRTTDGFFRGTGDLGASPGLWTLVLSQVTTWIFARSLLNAAILGYLYGIAGTLAYAAYYGSFLTGAWIIDAIRFRHGHGSVQSYMKAAFGPFGTVSYNIVVALRLLSEVFANLLVVGIIFGAAGTPVYVAAILAVSAVTLGYAIMGGLSASLRTDVVQMALLGVVLLTLAVILGRQDGFDAGAILASSPDPLSPGWILLVVALLQIWSYPLHDPVMMDRGFLADRQTTRRSFHHAFWLSLVCIVAFGLIGVYAGLHRFDGEALMDTLARLLSAPALLLVNLALVISAVSTLDSALSSASKLAVVDFGVMRPSVRNGRLAMAMFMGGGLLLLFTGNQDLFTAVAISGTASMFLAPVVVMCIWGGIAVPLWSYVLGFAFAIMGALVYFLDSSGYIALFDGPSGRCTTTPGFSSSTSPSSPAVSARSSWGRSLALKVWCPWPDSNQHGLAASRF
jgi:Na+/proline symporter